MELEKILKVILKYRNLSIFGLKNKKCEILNSEIEKVDEELGAALKEQKIEKCLQKLKFF